jgi:Flp pilus assembly protein TadD
MKLDENDPLYSEWSSGWRPSGGNLQAHSLSPHEFIADERETYPQTSPEHRARLQRYVKVTVAACVALCLAAVIRVGVSRLVPSPEASLPSRAAAAHPSEALAPVVPASLATPTTAAPSAPGAAPVRAVASAPALSLTKTAAQEREAARRALEKGKLKDAVAAAERATASDPTDAEAWLILGAASGELGHMGAARDAYRSCAKLAKHGPVRECAAMLR